MTSQSSTISTTTFDEDAPQSDSFAPPGHMIKGNISVGTGRRLYHTPGCEDYDETVIDLARGERWFRTASEAKASGWSDAHRR